MSFKHKSDQRGIAHLLFIVLGLVVVAAIGVAAWKVRSNNKNNSSSTGTSAKTTVANNSAVESACNKSINDSVFCKFASHFSLATAYTTTITSTSATSGSSTMTLKADGKNNTSLTATSGGAESLASVTLNGTSYIKDESTGVWIKYPASTSAPTSTDPTSNIKFSANDITANNTTSYKNLGKEACGSLTCYKYQVMDTGQAGTTSYIWFDTQNYQMRRYSATTADGTSDMTFSYGAVNITAPTPVQDFSATGQ